MIQQIHEKLFRTKDLYLASFLILYSHLTPSFEKKDGKIIFSFPSTDELYRGLQDFNNGEVIDASEYAAAIKRLRAEMIQKKMETEK